MKIHSHYKKIVSMSQSKFARLSDNDIINLYQFNNDYDLLLKNYTMDIDDETYSGIITGIFRATDYTYYRLEYDSNELYFMRDNDSQETIKISFDDFVDDIKQQILILRRHRNKEKRRVYIFASIILTISILLLLLPKWSEPLLVDYTPTQTHDYNNIADLYEDHSGGIVTIYTYSPIEERQSVATGMIITEDGYLISCTHIYDDIPNAEFNVILHDGSIHKATFVTGDIESDICLLKINAPDRKYPTVKFGNSDNVRSGDQCVIMGFPGGASVLPVVTAGVISSTDIRHSSLTGYVNSYIQTDATANPGNSGGGLFNMKGQVIGIITSKYTQSNYEGTIYSVSSSTIKKVINDLFYTGYISRPTLGITFTTTTNLEHKNGIPYGAKVVEIKESSNANGLLKAGDVIVEINGKLITPAYELYDALQMLSEDKLTLTCKVYDQETKEYKTITFNASIRYSNTGYITQ